LRRTAHLVPEDAMDIQLKPLDRQVVVVTGASAAGREEA
jgi:hypothetical protein